MRLSCSPCLGVRTHTHTLSLTRVPSHTRSPPLLLYSPTPASSVCTSQPLALLPPPFPSTSPLLMSIDALAVGEEHRRCGIATRLLQSVEVLGAWLTYVIDQVVGL